MQFKRDYFSDFRMEDPEFNECYDDIVEDMQKQCPIARSNDGQGYWVAHHYDDVRRCGQDWKTFGSEGGFQPNRPEDMIRLIPIECDPPYHTIWRQALNPYFSPGAVAKFENDIRGYVNDSIDSFIDDGRCDFVKQLAVALPGTVFLRNMIGVPVEDLPMLHKAFDDALLGPVENRGEGWMTVFSYVNDYLEKRSQQPPQGDLIDAVLKGVEYDRQPNTTKFSAVEWNATETPWEVKASVVTDLMSGALGNTTYVTAGAIHHMATNPEARRRLASDFSLLPVAMEEYIRYWAANVGVGRTAQADTEIGGQQIKKGDYVFLGWGLACRDPELVDDPRTIKIDRSPNRHVAFGAGPHRCIGSHLARLIMRVTLEEWLTRIPEFSLDPKEPIRFETGLVRVMLNLPLLFEAKGRSNS
jgi:cytochrome P450